MKSRAKKIFAHGATAPLRIEFHQGEPWLYFGSTVAGGEDYPVCFYGLRNIEELHSWLGNVIKELKDEK